MLTTRVHAQDEGLREGATFGAFTVHPCSSAAAQKRARGGGEARREKSEGQGSVRGAPTGDTSLSLSLHFMFYYQTHRGAERIFSYWINLFT